MLFVSSMAEKPEITVQTYYKSYHPTLTAVQTALALVLALFAGEMAFAEISGSKHDFSGEGWNAKGEICLPCHTPHNADVSPNGVPLWNHETSTALFTLYDSPTLKGTVEQPRDVSLACLSCHDGTVAIDSFGGDVGSEFITGEALIGADLADDHPVSIKWEHLSDGAGSPCLNCHTFQPTTLVSTLPFFDGYVECSTCHDVHNEADYPGLLRLPMQGSQLCLHCHNK